MLQYRTPIAYGTRLPTYSTLSVSLMRYSMNCIRSMYIYILRARKNIDLSFPIPEQTSSSKIRVLIYRYTVHIYIYVRTHERLICRDGYYREKVGRDASLPSNDHHGMLLFLIYCSRQKQGLPQSRVMITVKLSPSGRIIPANNHTW